MQIYILFYVQYKNKVRRLTWINSVIEKVPNYQLL